LAGKEQLKEIVPVYLDKIRNGYFFYGIELDDDLDMPEFLEKIKSSSQNLSDYKFSQEKIHDNSDSDIPKYLLDIRTIKFNPNVGIDDDLSDLDLCPECMKSGESMELRKFHSWGKKLDQIEDLRGNNLRPCNFYSESQQVLCPYAIMDYDEIFCIKN